MCVIKEGTAENEDLFFLSASFRFDMFLSLGASMLQPSYASSLYRSTSPQPLRFGIAFLVLCCCIYSFALVFYYASIATQIYPNLVLVLILLHNEDNMIHPLELPLVIERVGLFISLWKKNKVLGGQ